MSTGVALVPASRDGALSWSPGGRIVGSDAAVQRCAYRGVVMSSPAGWHADPSDPRVQRYWDGSGWTAQRVWNGAQWADTALGVPPPVVSSKRRRHRVLWIGGGVVAVIVAVSAVVAAAGGGGSHTENHAAFCRDLDNATGTFQRINPGMMLGNRYTTAQRAQMRQAASLAASLAARAPGEVKPDLAAIARDYNYVLTGQLSGDPADAINTHAAALVFWWSGNCTSV